MAVSSVLGPDGKTYTLEHPDGASQEDIFKFVHQSTQVKPEPTKPGVVGNVVRGIPAGAAAAGYDVLGAIGTMAYEGLGKYAKRGADPEYVEKIDQAVRGAQEKVAEYTFDIGATAGEAFGVDEGRFSADVGRGLGQLPLMVVTAGMASVPMSFAEVIKDAEQSLGVKYHEMSEEEKAKVAATGGAYAAFSLAADRIGLKYMGLTKLNKFFDGSETVKGSIVKDVLKGTLGEGLTETSQAVVKDQLARVYDDDREYNIDSVKEYLYEGAVGATVGGIASTGTSVVKNIGSETLGTKKSDLKKPVEDRPALEIPRTVQVEYKELDGQVRVVPISITEGQDPMAVAEEALAGRYDPAYGVTVTDQAQPVGPEQELDLPDQAPDPTQEDVPVQPEAAVEPEVVEAEAPAVDQAPVEQVLPEVVPQVVPATAQAPEAAPVVQEQAPAVRGNFRISPRMAKSKPRYRGQTVAYGSELELAVYMATGKGKNASKVRSELIEAGYSPAEINAMSEEVRAQMKKGYNPNSSKPISVAIAQDVTAEAAGVDRLSMSFKDVTKRTLEIQEQAKILRENIKAGDREQSRAVAQAADEFKPVQSYDFVPAPESNSEMRNALSKDKVNKLNAPVKDGAPVAVRLDIPAYVSTGTWVPVVHEQTSSFRPGTPMSYQATAVVDGATLGIVSDIAVSGIAAGKAKSTIATIKGNLKKVTPTQAKKMADKALKDPSYIQVGMDPERRGYFYNRETMQEVVAGDQAIQIGPLVLVKNPQYGATPSNEWLSLGPDVVAEAAPLEMSKVSDENNSSRIGTALQKGKNTTTPEDNVSPDRITPANLKKQMAKMTHFVKKVVKDGKEKGRNVKFPKWMRAKRGAKAQAEAFIKQFKDNLVALHNAFPAEYRTRATQWYDGARKIVDRAAEQTGLTSEQVAGVMAALSPLKDWFQNVQMGLNLVDVAVNDSDNVFTSAQYKDAINIVLEQSADNKVKNERKKLFKLLEGKTIRELFNEGTEESKQLAAWAARIISTQKHGFYHDVLSPEGNSLGIRRNKDGSPKTMVWQSIPFIVKSLDIVYDGSVQNISNQLGKKHKIRNFYNNIIAPNNPYGDATIDTHAVNATTLFPMGGSGYQADLNFGKAGVGGGGVSGTYWLHLEAYKQAAKEVGIQPRQMQSITWEAVRMLFPDSSKRDQKFLDKYEQIWNNSTDAETTRQQILSEGIEPPEWATYRPRPLSGTEAVEASVRENARPKVEPAGSLQADNGRGSRPDVTAQATDTEVEDRGPRDTYDNGGQVQDAIEQEFDPIGKKINTPIVMRMGNTDYVARYNATRGIIEYNPMLLLKRSKAGVRAAMREEIIHAAMHQVLMVSARKKFSMAEGGKVWRDFFDAYGKTLTAEELSDIKDVYQNIKPEDYVAYGSEYSRAVIQNLLYGEFSEQYQMQSQGGPAWNAIVQLLRSVQAYMAKVLGPMIKTNPEAAQVIVDSVELLKAADPSIRPKSQDVVAQAYDATDKNTAKENTEAGERVGQDASERIREERKWLDGAFRKTASKYLTPVITRLNRINPMFGRILQNLDSAIRMRSMGYRKQTEMFFNKLNAVKGAEFQELKQLMFFSPTPEEANLPSNKAKMQRRDALLHKHGLLNMYRLDVQPILEEIYTEYTALGMPKIGYLEDYFPRVIKDLEGLIKSYGHKTKRTFELLVNEENIRRSEMKDADGKPAPLPEMQETERARFFQDFLQGKFRLDLNGVKLPGNVKAREIRLIPPDKLKFYDNPGIAFGKYTTNMSRAIESFKVVGDTKKGEGRLLGELGKLTEELFTAGQIDEADANELKSLTELITSQFQAENEILKSLGTLTYMATLINPGPVLVQIMDLYKVALYRGLGGVVSGTYRTVTGNRRFDIERDFGIAKTQLSAEFEDPSFLTKALDFGLSRLVPFRQMDTAMKHASIEAAYDDFVKKAKAPVGSKKYQQLLDELTVTMGREDALKTISDLRLDKAMESTLVKEALLAELLQRQPLTYLQVPEGYQTDPSKRLFYKLSTFMLLDLNYNRQEFMNDLSGPGKTLQQRTVALRRLAYMATLLTMFGLPSDLLDDWIAGKDTYIPEHVMNNMLGMFGLSRYTTSRALNKGAVESVIQRFTPPAINIMIDGEQSLRSWVKGDKELFDIKSWRNSPLSDVWYYRTGGGVESQRKYQKKQRKEGITPTFDR